MAQRNNPFNNVKLVYRRSSALTKVVVLTVVVLSTVTLLALGFAIRTQREVLEDNRTQAIRLEQEKNRLQQYIEELGTIQGIIRIAQEKLGLIEPDSVVIQPE